MEKRDSETDSGDLIICSPAQAPALNGGPGEAATAPQ